MTRQGDRRARAPKKAAKRTSQPRARGRASSSSAASARPKQTGAQALVAQLEALGVEVVFGIPGVHNLAIFDALRRSSIRTVLVRHEQTCVYAADGYARATGKIGIAVTTTGPGAANTAAAMGEARASRVPVVHISTQVDSALREGRSGRFSLHESPHQRELMDAVAVWAGSVARAEAIPTMVQRAFAEALGGRRGPAFLEIPHDFLSAAVTWKAEPGPAVRTFPPDPTTIARAAEVLTAARRPIVWAGGGAIASGAGGSLAKVAEALDAPIVTTFAGKGIVPPDHPLSMGLPPHQPEVTKAIAAADAVLIVGSDLDAMNTQGWRLPLPKPRVAINTVATDCRRNYACEVVVEADAREALDALIPLLPTRSRSSATKRVADLRARAERSLSGSAEFAEAYAFVGAVQEVVPPDVSVLADMAIPGYWMAGYYRPPAPRAFAYPLGWGTLGFALPAAIGVSASGRRALVVAGDAGALFAIGELATAAQESLPITLLVVNDEGYGMLRFDERERYREEFAADLTTPDFVAVARAFGIAGRRCDTAGVRTALRWALKREGPSVVELRARFSPPLTTSPRWPLKGKPEARP